MFHHRVRYWSMLAGLAALAIIGPSVKAATFTWDSDANSSNGITDGSGTWTLTGSNWFNGSGDQLWTNTTDTAQFGAGSGSATAYSVALSAPTNAGGVILQNQAYSLSGSTLNLTGAMPTLTVNASGGTISSALAGTNGLIKSGTGLLTLTAANLYAGGTTISQGTLQLNNSTAAGLGAITLGDVNTGGNNVQLNINDPAAANAVTVANLGTGMATIGYLVPGGAVTYASTATWTLNQPATLTAPNLTAGTYLQFDPVLSGTGTLTVGTTNTARLILNGGAWANFTGNIVVQSGGIFEPRSNLTTPAGNNITVNSGGDLRIQFANTSIDVLSGAGTVDSVNAPATLTVGVGGGSGTFAGILEDNGSALSFTKSGSGTQVLTGANTYSGPTTISGGMLVIGGSGSLSSSSLGSGAYAGNIAVSSGAVLNYGSAAAQTFSGVISGGGGLMQSGSGVLTLAGTNSYSGGTTISAGLVIDGVSAIAGGAFGAFNPAATAINVQSSATLDINGKNSDSDFFWGLTIAGSGTSGQGALINNGASGTPGNRQSPNITLAANATIGGTGDIYMINGNEAADTLNLAGYTLTKTGSNTFYLCNTTVTAGTVNIVQGTFSVTNSASTAASTAFSVAPGASLALNGFDLPIGSLSGGGGTVSLGGNTLTVGGDNTSPAAYGGTISGIGGSLVKVGSGVLALSGVNTFGGNITVGGGTLQLISGHAAPSSEYVGSSSAGGVVQSGGMNSVSGSFVVGNNPGDVGTYNLSGSGKLSAFQEYIGIGGSGSFFQTGGVNSVTSGGSFELGADGGSGSYNLSGGLLAAPTEEVSSIGFGSFTQTGGTNSVTGLLYFGNTSLGSGSYNLGGGLLNTPSMIVGYNGSGSFTQTGGTVSGNEVMLGESGGGSYSLSGSGLLTANSEVIGDSGRGSFTQTGGTNTMSNSNGLYLGNNAGASGSYNLNGGLLVSNGEFVGFSGIGSFTQTGGTNSVPGFFYVGANGGGGSYSLSGSGLLTATYQLIGDLGYGTFTQSAGTNEVSVLSLGSTAGFSVAYNLSGGLLVLGSSSGLNLGTGTGALSFTGGTLQLPSGFTSSVPIVFSVSGSSGTFDTHGNTITISNPLSGPGGLNKGGAGTLILANSESYTGPTSVSGGTLVVQTALPSSGYIATGGVLQFNAVSESLGFGSIRASAGATVQYANATIIGGFLRGPGNHATLPGTANLFSGTTTYASTIFLQNGSDTFTNFTNYGQVTNSGLLVWDGGVNGVGGGLTVNNAVSLDDLANAGVITINSGGVLNNHLSDLTSGGGGQITVMSGGTLNADSQGEGVTLDLQDSLLVNNGTLTGTTNVNYGATVSGSGSFGPINLSQGGVLAISPSASPVAPSLFVSSGSIAGAGQSAIAATIGAATVVVPNLSDLLVLSGDLGGAGTLTKVGVGTVVISGDSSYLGGTLVEAGTLVAASPDALPFGGSLTVGAGGTLLFEAASTASPAIAAVPEPDTWALLAVAVCSWAVYRGSRSPQKAVRTGNST